MKDLLKEYYKDNESLNDADIIHIYDTELIGKENHGYTDSKIMNVVIYNTEKKERKDLGHKHSLFFSEYVNILAVRIFLDGSTMIRLSKLCSILDETVDVYIQDKFQG